LYAELQVTMVGNEIGPRGRSSDRIPVHLESIICDSKLAWPEIQTEIPHFGKHGMKTEISGSKFAFV
jgi:hypothetical protein